MNDLLSKEFEGKGVRIMMVDEVPQWNSADVCRILGYADGRKAIKDHCKPKGVSKHLTLTPGGNQLMTYLDEGNVLRLIARSNLPESEKFESWVFDTVIPEIRKTGSYTVSPRNYIEALEAHLEAAKRAEAAHQQVLLLTHENDGLRIELEALKDKISKIDPKAAAIYDMLINDGHASVADVGRALQIGGIKTMNKALVNAHIFKAKKSERGIYEPYQNPYIDEGYFTLNFDPDMKNMEYHITGKGVLWLNQFDLKRFISIDKIKEEASIKIESYSLFDKADIIVVEQKEE